VGRSYHQKCCNFNSKERRQYNEQKRREQIACVIEKLQHGASVLMKVQEEEQIAFDNLPEGIQYSGRGERWKRLFPQ